MKKKLHIIFALFLCLSYLLLLSCHQNKPISIPQSPTLKANIKAKTDAFAKEISQGNYDTVIQEGEKTLLQYKDSLQYDSIGWSMLHHRLGVAYSRTAIKSDSNYQKMNFHFKNAENLRILNPKYEVELANTYLNWGKGEISYNKLLFSVELFKKSNKILLSQNKIDTLRILGNFRGLNESFCKIKDLNFVNSYAKFSTTFYDSKINHSINEKIEYSSILINNGVFFEKINKSKLAIDNYIKSIKILDNDKEIEHILFRAKLNLAYSYIITKNTDAAKPLLKEAIVFFSKNKDSINLANAYNYYSKILFNSKYFLNAINLLEKNVFPIYKKNEDKEGQAGCQFILAEAYSQVGNYDKALSYYQKSMMAYLPTFKEADVMKNPSEEDLKLCAIKPDLVECLEHKAKTLITVGTKTKSTAYLEAAWRTYQTLSILQTLIREEISSEESKIDVSAQQHWATDAFALARQLQTYFPQKNYNEQAYILLQQLKAQVILEHLQAEKGKKLANISEELRYKERELLAELSQLRKQLLEAPNDANLMQKAILMEQKYQDFQEELAKQYPIFAQTKYDHKALSINEIQQSLKDKMAVLDYMPTEDSLHIFCITKKRLLWKTVAIDKATLDNVTELQHILGQAINKIETPSSADFLNRSYRCYQTLLSPIESDLNGVERLRIVAGGWVHRIGFESLLTNPYGGNWSDVEVPFLIKKYAVSYLFSVKELQLSQEKKKLGSVSVGSFGISYDDNLGFQFGRGADSCISFLQGSRGNGKLKYAVKEAENVKTLWGLGDCILEKEATKENFIKLCQSKHYNILHLAMHGIPDCEDAQNIQLVFSKDSSKHDNLMRMYEIAGLRMRSDLAVLSACHSGEGQLSNYEGVMSLGRAFAMAGCESLITSNSYVIDETSPQVFEKFYKNLKDNDLDKDLALQKAIVDYINDKSDVERLPYRWANFHLWGNIQPISGDSFNTIWLLWIGLGILSILAFFFWKKNENKV